jgi:hypothetical protein
MAYRAHGAAGPNRNRGRKIDFPVDFRRRLLHFEAP